MKEVQSISSRLKPSLFLLAAVAGLGGCSSAMHSIAVSNMTPESLAITTTEYRGQSCAQLAQQLEMFRKEQSQAGADELMRKSWGWRADAVQVVQNDQGCTPASAAAGKTVPKEMKMYFYCYVSEDIERVNTRGMVKSQTSVYTNVFERTVNLTDPMHRYNLAKAFTEEFKLKVVPQYDLGKTDPTCAFEDSAATANTMRQRMRDVFSGVVSSRNIDLAWQPTVNVQAAAPEKPTTAKNGVKAPAAIDVSALGARLEPVSDKVAKAAGLQPGRGASILATTAGGPAAKAGLKAKDIVIEISGQAVQRPEDVEAIASRQSVGAKVPVKVRRAGKNVTLTVQLASSPA